MRISSSSVFLYSRERAVPPTTLRRFVFRSSRSRAPSLSHFMRTTQERIELDPISSKKREETDKKSKKSAHRHPMNTSLFLAHIFGRNAYVSVLF
jgi:hypothetical protein